MIPRRRATVVRLRDVAIGGDSPIAVQSMTKTDTRDVDATSSQIQSLANAGCHIVRLAVPDMEAAEALSTICRRSVLPVVADIHFDHRLAVAAIGAGVDGLRLNPGNIRRKDHLRNVVSRARERDIPIRIGVNGGSVPHDYRPRETLPERMVSLALEQVGVLEDLGFSAIVVSLKASDVRATIEANRLAADRVPYPLHLGVTEAGPPTTGLVRNAVGIAVLLNMGIGDTIRVSLSGDPLMEVAAGTEILQSLGLAPAGPSVISCPTCGRTRLDVSDIAERVSAYLRGTREPVRVAVMGCVVNGPGECREADVGIAGGDDKVLVYRGGEFSHSVPFEHAYETLAEEIRMFVAQRTLKREKNQR